MKAAAVAGVLDAKLRAAVRSAGMIAYLSETATAAASVAQQDLASADALDDAITGLKEWTGHVTDAIQAPTSKSDQIGGIVATITRIAGQSTFSHSTARNLGLGAAGCRVGARACEHRRAAAGARRALYARRLIQSSA